MRIKEIEYIKAVKEGIKRKLKINKRIIKKGDISTPLTLVISLTFLLVFAIFVINLVTPFVWYQKLEGIANKYVYVIEKFGYLTNKEEKEMYEDLANEGFDTSLIEVEFPRIKQSYGSLFKFEIKYILNQSYSIISNGIKNEARKIPLRIKKYSYSKM